MKKRSDALSCLDTSFVEILERKRIKVFNIFNKVQNIFKQNQTNMSSICDSFPKELEEDVLAVLKIIPPKMPSDPDIVLSVNKNEYRLSCEIVSIPYRIYVIEPLDKEISQLTDIQKLILYCIYTRNSNGYLREKYIKKILTSPFEEWCIPFIVKLCDEYVIEILYAIYDSLKIRNNDDIKSFCIENKSLVCKSYSRMVSYWNEYYRAENYDIRKYIGRKLFRECMGYNRDFEKK